MARSGAGLLVVIALTGAACRLRGGPVLQPSLDSAAVAATALESLGRPYAFGGATPVGFDSSGFTHYVYSQHGIEFPGVAPQQYRVGTRSAGETCGRKISSSSARWPLAALRTAAYYGRGRRAGRRAPPYTHVARDLVGSGGQRHPVGAARGTTGEHDAQ